MKSLVKKWTIQIWWSKNWKESKQVAREVREVIYIMINNLEKCISKDFSTNLHGADGSSNDSNQVVDSHLP